MRPTGGIHLGNYLGYLQQAVDLSTEQDTECFFMIADYHALLSFRETPLGRGSLDTLAWEIAAGIDPTRATLFLQSHISAHTELAWIFNSMVSVSELNRMTQFKDLVSRGLEQPNAALLTYPVLQAADVLLYKATSVPVGKDQVQHLELTRQLARRFNKITGIDVFPEPQPRLTETAQILDLQEPTKKMSKSTPQGALLLEDDEATLRQKISRAVTDTGSTHAIAINELPSDEAITQDEVSILLEQMSPGVRNLFILLRQTASDTTSAAALLENYRSGTLQYRDLKAATADSVIQFITPLQEKYRHIRSDETMLNSVLEGGKAKANQVATQTLMEVKEALKLFH